MDALEFDVTLKSIPVKLKFPGETAPREYELVELMGYERDQYLNTNRKRFVLKDDKATVSDFEDYQASLIVKSLRRIIDGQRTPVTLEEVRTYPSPVQMALFTKAQELSGIGAGAKKNKEGDDEGED